MLTWRFLAGHEVTHAFDSITSLFDFEGDLDDIWSDETRQLFNET